MTRHEGLIYHAGALGDFVLSLPAIHRVVQANPGLTWYFWGPSERRPLLPSIRRAVPEVLRLGHTFWGDHPDTEAVAHLRGYHVVLAFGGRSAPPWTRWCGSRALPVASFPPAAGPWVPMHQARQLDAFGVPRLGRAWIPDWRRRVLPERDPREILIHPGSGDRKKNIPLGTWKSVVRDLQRGLGLPARVLLGPAEVDREEREAFGGFAEAVQECQALCELLEALAQARVFVGNDSGVAHLAGLAGVPTVAVFGPTDSRIWRPLGQRVHVLASNRPCAPCTAGDPISCEDPECLEELGHREIVEAALQEAHLGGIG